MTLAVRSLTFSVASLVAGLVMAAALSFASEALSAHERSDRFWGLVRVSSMAAESYASMHEMAIAADAVVVGRVMRVEDGREWVANPGEVGDPTFGEGAIARFATVSIAVERVIGVPRVHVGEVVPLEIYLPHDGLVPTIQNTLPQERALWFIRNKGPSDSTEFFRLVNDEQGLLREFGGVVHGAGHDPFVLELEGAAFDEVIAEVAAALE